MSDVTPNLRDKGPCECRDDTCSQWGTLGRADRQNRRHVRGCPCNHCRGKRNRRKGDDKARVARKRMGLAGANTRHEELWGGPFRVEMKAGMQVKSLTARFVAAEAQSEQARPVGDPRPFAFVAMPDGMSDGLVTVRLSVWEALIAPLLADAS